MKLFLVRVTNMNNQNYAGVVVARTPREAMSVFMDHAALDSADFEEREPVEELDSTRLVLPTTEGSFVLGTRDLEEVRP